MPSHNVQYFEQNAIAVRPTSNQTLNHSHTIEREFDRRHFGKLLPPLASTATNKEWMESDGGKGGVEGKLSRVRNGALTHYSPVKGRSFLHGCRESTVHHPSI